MWLSVCALFVVYDTAMTPVEVFFGLKHSTFTSAIRWTSLFWWCADILVSFRTGYYVNGAVQMKAGKIARQYLTTYFLFDLTCVILEVMGGEFVGFSRTVKVLRLV